MIWHLKRRSKCDPVVGKVPWRDMVDELEEKKKDDGVEMADLRFLDME